MSTGMSVSTTRGSGPNHKSKPQDLEKTTWIPGGNLIIKVTEGEKAHLHRVHSSILAFHSKVFADMVEVSAGQGQGTIEGCPVVELHDRPQDIQWLLQVIHLPGILPIEKLRRATLEKLEPIFFLADKYEMSGLTKRLVPMLERDWPTTLEAWDVNEAEVKSFQRTRERQDLEEHDGLPTVDDVFPEPCRVIAIARRCGLDSVLPSAFYHLSRIDVSFDPNSFDPDDDDDYERWEFFQEGGRTADAAAHLTTQDWSTLHFGTGTIRRWCAGLMFHVETLASPHKVTSPKHKACSTGMEAIGKALELQLYNIHGAMGYGIDPLAIMEAYRRREHEGLCYKCADRLNELLSKKRSEFWQELPGFFRLKGWSNTDSPSEDD